MHREDHIHDINVQIAIKVHVQYSTVLTTPIHSMYNTHLFRIEVGKILIMVGYNLSRLLRRAISRINRALGSGCLSLKYNST